MSPRNETPAQHEERRERENSEAARENIRRNDERVTEAHRLGVAAVAPLEGAFTFAPPRKPLPSSGIIQLRMLRRFGDAKAGDVLDFNVSDTGVRRIAGDLLDRDAAEIV